MPKSGLANRYFTHGKKNGIRTKYEVRIDDLIIWRKGRTVFGHVERVISVLKAGWVKTIAFNVKIMDGPGSSAEGVSLKRRNIYHPLGRLQVRGIVGFRKTGKDC